MRRVNRPLFVAGAAFLLWSVAYSLATALLVVFAAELGASPVQGGFVLGLGAGGAILLVFPVAWLSDHSGRTPALLTAWSISAVGFAIMAAAPAWTVLAVGSLLAQSGLAALPTLNALILDEAPSGHGARLFSRMYAAGPLGQLVGAALGGVAAAAGGLRLAFVVAAASSVLAVMTVLVLGRTVRAAAAARLGAPASSAQAPGAPVSAAPPPVPAPARPPPAAPGPALPASGEPAALPRAAGRGALLSFGLLAAAGFTIVNMPGNFIVPYLHQAGGQSVFVASLLTSYLAAAQLAWSLLFSVWPVERGYVQVGTLRLSAGTVTAVGVCLLANAVFGLLLPWGWAGAWLLALFLRGSQYSLQALGSALLGDVVPAGAGRTMRLTWFSGAIGIGAAAAPVLAGWLYTLDPALPFLISGLAAAGGAVVVTVVPRLLGGAGRKRREVWTA